MEGQYLLSSKAQDDGMKIQHNTYNETHQKLGRRASASQKMRFYISRLTCNSGSDQPSVLVMTPERPGVPTQNILEDQLLVTSPEEYMPESGHREILTRAREEVKGIPRKGPTFPNTTTSEGAGPLKSVSEERQQREVDRKPKNKLHRNKAAETGQAMAIPMQRHKGTFCQIVMEKLNRRSTEVAKEERTQDPNMDKIRIMRQRIKDGKLERVVPPTNPGMYEHGGRLVPPPPRNFVYELSPPGSAISFKPLKSGETDRLRASSRNRKTKSSSSKISASSKVAACIGSGAEFLDETRREMASKLRPQFLEHTNHSSFSLSRRSSVVSVASLSSSFYCVGEGDVEQEAQTKYAPEPRWRRADPPEQEIFGARGTSPWVTDLTRMCMFCGKNGVARSRKLCNGCEKDFLRRKQILRKNGNKESEIKPIPPPKDCKIVVQERSQQWGRRDPLLRKNLGDAGEGQRPPIPPKNKARSPLLSQYRHAIIQPVPSNHLGGAGSSGSEEPFGNRPSQAGRNEAERMQKMFNHWADCYGEMNFDSSNREQDDKAEPPIKESTDVRRDTDFYSFWDRVLDDDGRLASRL